MNIFKNKSAQKNEDEDSSSKFQIHTMQGDLEKMKNPQMPQEEQISINKDSEKSNIKFKNEKDSDFKKQEPVSKSEPIKNNSDSMRSPFLEDKSSPNIATAPDNLPQGEQGSYIFTDVVDRPGATEKESSSQKISMREEKSEVYKLEEIGKDKPKKANPNSPKKPSPKKFAFLAVAILIFLLLVAGGYYFWSTRINVPTEVVIPETTEPITTEESTSQPEENFEDKLTTDAINTITLTENATGQDLIDTLLEMKNDVKESNLELPFEFSIQKTDSSKVSLKEFSDLLGITLPETLFTQSGTNFSLFSLQKNNNFSIALVVNHSDTAKNVQTLMLSQEATLPQSLKSFLAIANTPPAKENVNFSDNTHESIPTRYFNLIGPDILSIDYAVSDKKLFIATTKNLLFETIDLDIKTTTTTSEDASEKQESESGNDPALYAPGEDGI